MRVDLHLHTAERSFCASSAAIDQLTVARGQGLDAVAITDHHALVSSAERAVLAAQVPGLILIPGIEITLDHEAEDILVLGLDDRELETRDWDWSSLRAFVRERGGTTILAHPYRYAPTVGLDLADEPPDAIEGHSSNVDPDDHARIRRLAADHALPLVANSDAHSTRAIGRYANRLDEPASTAAEILAAIRTGRFTPEHPA
ncbi:hypothetical protein GF314_16480 [bacterium]|nr:hypothetical protein [bacterium]